MASSAKTRRKLSPKCQLLVAIVKKGLFRDLLVVIDWLETHIVLAESPGRLWPKAIRTSWARLFAWAGRVRYAWRPAATRTMVRETVAAARQPTRIDGAIPSFC